MLQVAQIWDLRQPVSSLTMAAHEHEILSVDWNKYNDCLVATGSVDKTVRIFDVRMPMQAMHILHGHTYAVRRVKCSPHSESLVYSCSYDMTMCMWDFARQGDPLVRKFDHHTEFAIGLDVSSLVEGMVASTGWDAMVYVWNQNGNPLTS
ncbi:peroxisomal targeting signal 2 receptor [Cymbomonas tetramitiformis]|uniref:Peroxin-7 n=1 Tax=Cymbomonas tetramitiformis TaxID=36881 RepID=A0AAE0KPA5_9CHLO|nr:peroxisomal targeting signal 2 receptor [Cymbomonas tetramitiformis]